MPSNSTQAARLLTYAGILPFAIGLAGQVFAPDFLDSADFWNGAIFYNENLIHRMHAVPYLVKYAAFIVMVLGFIGAWWAYIRNPSIPAKFVEQFRLVHQFVYNKWYFDELYNAVFVKPAFWLGQPRTHVGTFIDYLSSLVGWERFRAAQFGIRHYCTIGLNSKEANNEELAEGVMVSLSVALKV